MTVKNVKVKDPGSAITHGIGSLMALLAAVPLLAKASLEPDLVHVLSLGVFIFSMFLLYTASTVYHTFDVNPKVNKLLKKFDHMSIYLLIAGSYTPICLIVLNGSTGYMLLAIIWGMAIAGICFTAFWVNCPKWISSAIYVVMGWTCVLAFGKILHYLPHAAFMWLLAGGIIYTIGGIIYAIKLPLFNSRHKNFGTHEIFHLFCLGGSACHFVVMYSFVANMAI